LTGEYSQKPIETNEIKPGNPEWNLTSFSSDKTGVTLSQTDSITGWSTTGTRSVKSQTTTSTDTDDYKLTFVMKVRFPKIKKSDNTQLVIDGQKQYFGPYTCSATADLKVIKIIIKRRVAGQGEFVTISDTQNVSSVIVGQKVELKVEVKPDNTNFSNTWSITNGNPIKDYQPTKEKAEVKNLTNADYSQKNITYYCTAGGNTTVKATVKINEENKEKSVGFGILRPTNIEETGVWYPENNPINLVNSEQGREIMCQIDIFGKCKIPINGQGEIGFIQKVNNKTSIKVNNTTDVKNPNYNLWRLDEAEDSFLYDNPKTVQANTNQNTSIHDSPGMPVARLAEVHLLYGFQTYFMYKPTGGIWVTLAKVEWAFEGKYVAGQNITVKNWAPKPPVGKDSTELPIWERPNPIIKK
jgi:hypothetical protein